jgi:hypothetical protein
MDSLHTKLADPGPARSGRPSARDPWSARRRRIAAAAARGSGWLDLPDPEGGPPLARVPRAPFLRWALKGTGADGLMPAWTPVCPADAKMPGDDRDHTDWMVGAGLPLDGWYAPEAPVRVAAFRLAGRLVRDLTGREAMVLCGRGAAVGRAVHPRPGESVGAGRIAVLRSADARYLEVALAAARGGGAVLVESGGALTHLVQVAAPQGVRILRLAAARSLFEPGSLLEVDCDAGRVRRLKA